MGLWLFGVLADTLGFAGAALALGLVTVLCASAALGMPETRDLELDDPVVGRRMAGRDAPGQ